MHFKISKEAYSFFENIVNKKGSHAASDKNKFLLFDIYYCCALIGMAAIQLNDDSSNSHEIIDKYPDSYNNIKAYLAGLLVSTEVKRLGINVKSFNLEKTMMNYISDGDTLLSEEGIKTLNSYALKGYDLIRDYPLYEKPSTREEFMMAFYKAIEKYEKK